MKPKIDKSDIKVQLFNAYNEYVYNHYPSDPNVYVIRAHPETVYDLITLVDDYQVNISGYDWVGDGEQRFLAFRLKDDIRLPPGDIIFGPETVDIKWSK